jgi:uncharacterized damage-inducible protein DinB
MPGQVRPIDGELEQLLGFLAHQRHVLRIAAYGLTEEQLRATPTVSPLSVGGLIKHCIAVERSWIDDVEQRSEPFDMATASAKYLEDFRMATDETLDGLIAEFEEVAAETERVVRSHDLDRPVPVPKGVPWFPDDLEAWTVRWVLLHLISEHARHAGHADLIRESIDGATAFPLMAAVEGWPASPWMQPWSPSDNDADSA